MWLCIFVYRHAYTYICMHCIYPISPLTNCKATESVPGTHVLITDCALTRIYGNPTTATSTHVWIQRCNTGHLPTVTMPPVSTYGRAPPLVSGCNQRGYSSHGSPESWEGGGGKGRGVEGAGEGAEGEQKSTHSPALDIDLLLCFFFLFLFLSLFELCNPTHFLTFRPKQQ